MDELPDIALQAISKLPEQERLPFYYQLDPKDEKYEEKVKDLLNFCVQRKIKIEDLSLSLWPKLNAKEHNKLIKLLIYYGTDIEKIPKVAPDVKNLIDEAAKLRQVVYQKLVAKEIDPLIISRYTFPSREDLTPEQIIEGANLCLARDVRQL